MIFSACISASSGVWLLIGVFLWNEEYRETHCSCGSSHTFRRYVHLFLVDSTPTQYDLHRQLLWYPFWWLWTVWWWMIVTHSTPLLYTYIYLRHDNLDFTFFNCINTSLTCAGWYTQLQFWYRPSHSTGCHFDMAQIHYQRQTNFRMLLWCQNIIFLRVDEMPLFDLK